MAVTDWKFAGTGANDNSVGNAAWSNTGNITASNNSRATTATMGAGQTSQILRATNFGFTTSDIPSGSTIDGIEVRIERSRNATGGNQVQDNLIRLRLSSGQTGDNKVVAGNWPNSDGQATYGGESDKWNTSLTDSQIRGSDFGVDIRCERTGGTAASGGVDAVEIRIHYTEAGTEHTRTPSDTLTLSDSATKQVGKVNADTITLSDSITSKQLSKVLSDTISFSDEIVKDVEITKSDSVLFSDDLSKQSDKSLSDDVILSDEITDIQVVLTLNLSDEVSFTDDLNKEFLQALSDDVSLSDDISKELQKEQSDEISFADQSESTLHKNLSDSLSLSDDLNKNFSKVVDDSLSFADEFDYELTIGNPPIELSLSDTVNFTDGIVSLELISMPPPTPKKEEAPDIYRKGGPSQATDVDFESDDEEVILASINAFLWSIA